MVKWGYTMDVLNCTLSIEAERALFVYNKEPTFWPPNVAFFQKKTLINNTPVLRSFVLQYFEVGESAAAKPWGHWRLEIVRCCTSH